MYLLKEFKIKSHSTDQTLKFLFRYDWIQFYDGKDQSGHILGCGRKWCGQNTTEISSTGNQIFIKFQSDADYGTSGFNISYEVGNKIYLYSHR